jgi:Insertion element 4 transposase N-terminal/Transposase DDE domain
LEQAAIARTIRVAAGVFAPGHIGELTRIVPFEMVDDVLARTGRVQARVRLLPARAVVYLLLAAALFAELGYGQVWDRMCAGLGPLAPPRPCASALRQARQRLGAAPLKALFELLAGPAPTLARWATRYAGLLVVAIDGTVLSVPDTAANLTAYAKHRCPGGGGGYPQLRLLALLACGTRTVIGAVFGTATIGESTWAGELAGHLKAGMLLLADRNFAAQHLLATFVGTGAHLLVRAKSGRRLPPIARLADGTYLARMGLLTVRVIDAEITIVTAAGRASGHYRLITTLTDPAAYPALDLVRLYHQRWEIETCYAELKSTILGGRVLRARTPAGIEQEMWALLTAYQVLRTAMTDATDARPGTDPDRAAFTIALYAARDQLVLAAGVIADTVIDLVGTIGRHILADLLPDRRMRTKARIVKRAISKYNARGPNIDRTTYKAAISIEMLTAAT